VVIVHAGLPESAADGERSSSHRAGVGLSGGSHHRERSRSGAVQAVIKRAPADFEAGRVWARWRGLVLRRPGCAGKEYQDQRQEQHAPSRHLTGVNERSNLYISHPRLFLRQFQASILIQPDFPGVINMDSTPLISMREQNQRLAAVIHEADGRDSVRAGHLHPLQELQELGALESRGARGVLVEVAVVETDLCGVQTAQGGSQGIDGYDSLQHIFLIDAA
jgi:hypothetical protein